MNSLLSDLYTLEGRIGRLYFLWRLILLGVLGFGMFFTAVMGEPILKKLVPDLAFHGLMIGYFLMMAVLILMPPFTLMTRRLHDAGFSGWILVVFFVLWLCVCAPIVMHFGVGTGLEMVLIINGGIVATLILFLLIWPGQEGTNKYGQGQGSYHTNINPSKKDQVLKKASSKKYFNAILAVPIPEDNLYLFKYMKTEYPDIQKINIPEDRQKVEFIIMGYSSLNASKLHKILSGLGIGVRAVRKKSV